MNLPCRLGCGGERQGLELLLNSSPQPGPLAPWCWQAEGRLYTGPDRLSLQAGPGLDGQRPWDYWTDSLQGFLQTTISFSFNCQLVLVNCPSDCCGRFWCNFWKVIHGILQRQLIEWAVLSLREKPGSIRDSYLANNYILYMGGARRSLCVWQECGGGRGWRRR